MSYIVDVFMLFSKWMRADNHLFAIAGAMVATVLIIYGNDINRKVRHMVGNRNFFLRLLVFILLCSVGYAFVGILIAKVLAMFLSSLRLEFLSPFVIIVFVLIGLLAEHKNHM